MFDYTKMKLACLVLLGLVTLDQVNAERENALIDFILEGMESIDINEAEGKRREMEGDDSDSEDCDAAHPVKTCPKIKDGGACIRFTLRAGGNKYHNEDWDMDAGETWDGCYGKEVKQFLENQPGRRNAKKFNDFEWQRMWWQNFRSTDGYFDKEDFKECPALKKFSGSFGQYIKSAGKMCPGWGNYIKHLKDTWLEANLEVGQKHLELTDMDNDDIFMQI